MVSEIEVKVKSNFDEEIKKAKELVDLLERANELILSLNKTNIKKDKFSYTCVVYHILYGN